MTNEQIIKALECLHNRILQSKFAEEVTETEILGLTEAFDLINRQQAEIERWKNEAICYQDLWCEGMTDLQTAKSEAYKEFAERLKQLPIIADCEVEWMVLEFHDLVKELTEVKDDE